MPMKNFQDLFIDEIKDLYHAEKQVLRAMPKMIKSASSEELKTAFEEHLKQTETQIDRLEKVFKELDMTPKGKKCLGMEGILGEGKEMMEEDAEDAVLDAALISAAQKVEHYEIASYGTVRSYAQQLGFTKIADLLQETLDEESETNEKLNMLAEKHINIEALQSGEEE
ncbi:MAG TPA: ferritin-like domain-containing protein [Ignavibacteriaceae bacterium]|nr:ferritin-like domain-containing protein [Ignavibacteriaceae bacterium]